MKSRDIASLAFKIIGIIVLLRLTNHISWIIHMCTNSHIPISEHPNFNYAMISFGVSFAAGLVLILGSNIIAGLVCKKNDDINISCTRSELQAIAFSCIAVWLIYSSLSALVINVIHYLKVSAQIAVTQAVKNILINVLRLFIGIALFIQSRGLVAVWEKLNKSRNPVRED